MTQRDGVLVFSNAHARVVYLDRRAVIAVRTKRDLNGLHLHHLLSYQRLRLES